MMEANSTSNITLNVSTPNSNISDEVSVNLPSGFNTSGDFVVTFSDFPLVPNKALVSYLVCANGIGVLLNLLVVAEVFKKKRNGLNLLLAQMAASDILMLTAVAVPEMLSLNSGSWNLGSEMCVIYLGFEVFAGTSIIYFLVAICLHTIATANLISRAKVKRDSEEELLEDITEMKSSQHSLVTRRESSPARIAITSSDESLPVPVIFPISIVWILSASLSAPEFLLSTTIDVISGPSICNFADANYLYTMRLLLSIFQLLIPLAVLFLLCVAIIYKLSEIKTGKQKFQEHLVRDVSSMLRLSLSLCCVYLFCNVPRSVFSSIQIFLRNGEDFLEELDHFKTPPLNFSNAIATVPFVLSGLHFLASSLKPIFYVNFTKNMRHRMFTSFVKYKKTTQEQEL